MTFELKDVLQAVGPNASLVFAAWIFLTYLEARYGAAFERYRALSNDYRQGSPDARHDSIYRQILIYKRRCGYMRFATNVGVVSATLLIATLIFGGLDVVLPNQVWIPPLATACALVGLLLVIVSAVTVLFENHLVKTVLDEELADIPEFASPEQRDRR